MVNLTRRGRQPRPESRGVSRRLDPSVATWPTVKLSVLDMAVHGSVDSAAAIRLRLATPLLFECNDRVRRDFECHRMHLPRG